jgi:hypothetical protein
LGGSICATLAGAAPALEGAKIHMAEGFTK